MRLLIDLDPSILKKIDDLALDIRRKRKQTIQLVIENYFEKNTFEKTSIDMGEGKQI